MPTPSSSSTIPPLGTAGPGFMSVPSTQNTALVIKFRCLYTYDIRRKAKRWQDGFLRYHTFNKRIMVYDLTGNFVGDHHWRQEEGIQDGDEMELDKGVLVQVCEGLERTQTDLSALFGKKTKKRSSQDSPQSNGVLTQVGCTITTPTRTPMSSSSQLPRSLNDLLGIKKTPIGRAVTPKSPHENRHPRAPPVNDSQNSERITKRQRVSPAKQSLHQHENSSSVPSHNSPELLDLDMRSTSSKKKTPCSNPTSRTLAGSRAHQDSRKPASNTSAVSNVTTTPDDTRPRGVQKQKDSSTRNDNEIQTPTTHLPEKPKNTLRLSTAKPRKKLMYSALLPGHDQGKGSPSSSSSSSLATTATTTKSKTNGGHYNKNNNNETKTNNKIYAGNATTIHTTTPRPFSPPHASSKPKSPKNMNASLFCYDDEPLNSPILEKDI